MLAAHDELPLAAYRLRWTAPSGAREFERMVRRRSDGAYELDGEGRRALHAALIGSEYRSEAAVDEGVREAARAVAEARSMALARQAHYERYAHGPLPARHHVVYGSNDRARSDAAMPLWTMSAASASAPDAHREFLAAQQALRRP